MNQELAKKTLVEIESDLSDFEKYGNDEFEADNVIINAQTARNIVDLLRYITTPATWVYYRNDEGKARWKCSNCGKICRRNPHDKKGCSNCLKRMVMES